LWRGKIRGEGGNRQPKSRQKSDDVTIVDKETEGYEHKTAVRKLLLKLDRILATRWNLTYFGERK
jgi:hypothetical protein